MRYTIIQTQPKDAQKKLDSLAAQGWRVVSQSESTWVIAKCFGLSKKVDSIINIILERED